VTKRRLDSLVDEDNREYTVDEVRERLRQFIKDYYPSQADFARECSSRTGMNVSAVKVCDILSGRSNSFGSAILQMLCLKRKDIPRSSVYEAVSEDEQELVEV
jgi:hypothetical protein